MTKIQNEAMALCHMVSCTDTFNSTLLYFIHGAKIHPDALNSIFGNKHGKSIESERKARFTWCSKTEGRTIDQIAHQLWQENLDLDSDANPETDQWRDAVEEVILSYNSPVQMAKDLVRKFNPTNPELEVEEETETAAVTIPSTAAVTATTVITEVNLKPETLNLKLIPYTDRSIALIGDTRQFKDKLKELWGRYNPNLRVNGETVRGWVFSVKREPQLRQLIAS